MIRAAVGVAVGGAGGFAAGFGANYFTFLGRGGTEYALIHGALIGAIAATAGAVVGATGDVLAYLRKAVPPRGPGPEGDYREP